MGINKGHWRSVIRFGLVLFFVITQLVKPTKIAEEVRNGLIFKDLDD
jgi:hypothetical protein